MVLPVDKVMYQAQEVAAVIATDRYIAADAVEAVEVEYEPLPVVVDPFKALEPGATVLRTDNRGRRTTTSATGKPATAPRPTKAFADSDVRVKQDIYIPRIHVASIETCGCVADFDKAMGHLTVYMTTQAPHAIRTVFALVPGTSACRKQRIRIVSPDIGGGFGGKVPVYPGYVIAVAASVVLGKPVKWIEDRMREPAGRLLRPRLPHDTPRSPPTDDGKITGAARQDDGRPRLRRRRGEPVEVPGRPLLHLHRLLRHAARLRRGRRRLHQQAAGRRRLPLLVPGDRSRSRHRAHGRHAGRTSSGWTRRSCGSRTSSGRTSSRTNRRSAGSTTAATTTRRSTRRWR